MSKPSRLVKPSKQSRREPPGNRSHMLVVGERLMRAGSEGNLVKSRQPQKSSDTSPVGSNPEPARSNQRLCSHEDVDSHSRKQSSADESEQSEPWSPRTVPRRHTVGGPRTAGDVIVMQSYNMDHKKEAFLEHLKQKYPHHASVIMGHQERLRDQIRSSGHSVTPQPAVGEPGEHLSLAYLESLEAMSEGEAPSAFTRGSRSRASLPVVKSNNQTKDRSLGVLYLQYGEETKQIRMPNEVTSADTIKALFVSAFPQHLTMKTLESPSVAIYVKDDMRNMYYELTDVRNVTSHSCLKVYHKDPAQAFNHNARANNGEIRITRERLYSGRQQPGGQSPVHTLPHSPIHSVQGSMSPPTPRSMPSSPSRIPFGHSVAMPGGATLPRDRISNTPPSRSITPCSSAILERRDVKPDEDLSSKSVPLYSEAYGSPEGRLSVASSQSSHTGDVPDGAAYIQHRSTVKSVGAYADGQDLQHSLYRQKSRKYSESQLATMGSKTPPASPHRVNEVRMIDMLPGQNSHMPSQGVAAESASPVRRSFRKDNNGAVEVATRVRGNVASPVFADLPPSHGERPFQGHVAAGDPQSERIKAMEQQIASLTGLVQHALMKGPNTSAKETSSEKLVKMGSPAQNGGVCTVTSTKDPVVQTDCISTQVQPPVRDPAICSILSTFRRNVSDLRLQLHQLKQMQLQNQDAMRQMLRQAEQEISERFSDTVLQLEDPVHRQRVQVEEERHRYLGMEETVLVQLGELENYVEMLKKESTCAISNRPVTLKDVEEGAVNLRRVGEALATLKGEFPALQMKMRGVLRVEVDAVRFLKEEPHKMDSMLKRVKALTDTLSGLRRYATESHNHTSDPLSADSVSFVEEYRSPKPVCESPTPQPRSPAKVSCSEPVPSSPVTVHRVQTAPISTHHPSPPLTPTHSRDSPTVAKVSPRSRENSPALQKRAAPQGQEAVPATAAISTTGSSAPEEISVNTSRPMPDEVSKRAVEEDKVHSTGLETKKEMERILQQTQASLMKAIPDLEVSKQVDSAPSQPPSILPDEVDSPLPVSPLPEAAPQDGPKADKPVQTSLERPQKSTIEKPHRAGVDRVQPNPETASKSPPPPPPRRFYPSGSGLTTGRSGEVIYTTRKESTSEQEGEEEAPKPKPLRVPPEVKPKPRTPPPVNTSTLQDEEDEGDKIMAELQQTTSHLSEEGALSESWGDSATPGSPGVMYYITGTSKTSRQSTSRPDDLKEPKEATFSPSKVAPENASDLSQQQKLLTSNDLSVISLQSSQSVKEVQSKQNNIHKMPSGPCNSLKNSTEAEKRASLINPKELKTESVLKSLKQVVPTPSEKVSPVEEKLEQQILHTSSEQVEPVLDKSVKHGHRTTTVKVTLVSKCPQSAELQVHSPVHQPNTDASFSTQPNNHDNKQDVTKRSSEDQARYTEEASLSPDLPGEEGPPPPNNIAFRITKTKVQALSTGEYQQLVNSKGTDVQTLKVGTEPTLSAPEDSGFDKKPVIIIFDEPMDIHQAYKRLSTIFECEEELERVLSEERIDEENEEEVEANSKSQVGQITPRHNLHQCRTENRVNNQRSSSIPVPLQQQSSFESSGLTVEEGDKTESPKDVKKKFKFKFPKKQLVAIGQALRTGTKTGKKTLQVVVYEDEEEPDGTVTELKEAKRFEMKSHADSDSTTPRSLSQNQTTTSQSTKDRTEELRKTTYETLDSLEQTIKQLESTISDIGPTLVSEVSRKEESKAKRMASDAEPEEGSPTKKPAPLKPKPHKSSLQKRSRTSSSMSTSSSASSSKQNSGDSPASSRISSPKSRQQPAGSVEKPGKPQKLQDSQRQFRQANGSAMKAGGNSKHAFLALPASKIPAFIPSSWKHSSTRAAHSKLTNQTSSSSSKSSIPCLSLSWPSCRPVSPSQQPEGQNLTLPPQTQNGQSCSYSYSSSSSSSSCSSSSSSSVSPTSTSSSSSPSSPSLLSPTAMCQGGRAVHMPSFSSRRSLKASSGQAAITPASFTGNMA
ncbi:sickle tail protein homolog isoform X3 [Onychostoma macrolepis]|uniref:sickle tail protein homolog isoform X3 n=1 Tax=Onychostoma macrolepis TaxID=369639 RepID=UPI00272AE8E8|nr:sickle tail protein homolog isoform X3 [Onychostoma macrolepis]